MFADADDYFIDEKFNDIWKYLRYKYDIVYFPPTSISEDTQKISDRHKYSERLVKQYMRCKTKRNELRLRYNFEAPWSKLIKMKLIKENHIIFDETRVANDIMFSAKVGVYADRIAASKRTIYCVTKSDNTLTTTKDIDWFRIRLGVFVKKQKYLKQMLSEEDFELLDPTARGVIINAIREYGLSELLHTIIVLKRNEIQIRFIPKINHMFHQRKR